jgi:hypothetical protein
VSQQEASVSFGSAPVEPGPKSTPRRRPTALESIDLPKGVKDPTYCNVTRASAFPRVKVVIDESQNPSDPSRALVIVNGRAYDIQRGIETDLPPEVVEALENAVADKVFQSADGEIHTRPTKRFPFRIQDEEGQRVMAAWKEYHEKQRKAG